MFEDYEIQMNPVEQLVMESVLDLEKHQLIDTKSLEAEAIYLAAFIYLRGSSQIDFEVDYLPKGLLDKIESGNLAVADKVFEYMIKYGKGYYQQEEADYGINGYRMNILLCPDYGSYIKNYFVRAHKIGLASKYEHFISPRNCLWRNGMKVSESPTQRDIYYKIQGSTFELMIPPYNPLVTGQVVSRTRDSIKCLSNDNKRAFVFYYEGGICPENLALIEMYRNDKGDMVSYHKQ